MARREERLQLPRPPLGPQATLRTDPRDAAIRPSLLQGGRRHNPGTASSNPGSEPHHPRNGSRMAQTNQVAPRNAAGRPNRNASLLLRTSPDHARNPRILGDPQTRILPPGYPGTPAGTRELPVLAALGICRRPKYRRPHPNCRPPLLPLRLPQLGTQQIHIQRSKELRV